MEKIKKKRPEFIKHYSEIKGKDDQHYPESNEPLSIGSPFGKFFGLKRLGIHHEILPPGRRTSWPHAESTEEEFVYVIEGTPDAWIDGHLHRLAPGDGVGFPSGTGITHTFINNTKVDVRLLVVGEANRADDKIYYPLNPERKAQIGERWWHDVPSRPLGPHNGLPDEGADVHRHPVMTNVDGGKASRAAFRKAEPADREEICQLLVAQFKEHAISLPPDQVGTAIEGVFKNDRGSLLLAILNAKIIGVSYLAYTWTLEHGGKSAWLEELYIAPEHRGNGIGEDLLRYTLAFARENDCVAIDLEVEDSHRRVETLYRRLEFRPHTRSRWVKVLSRGKWQPFLEGLLIELRPLVEEDFESLYAAGSDPLIWEQHPEHDRYQRDKFSRYFRSGIESRGALAIIDRASHKLIGSSRFTGHDAASATVEIGYTFLSREYWGKGHNSELKRLMLDYAFQFVDKVHFYIGESNFRSRRAVEKLGAKLIRSEARTPLQGDPYTAVVYELRKSERRSS